MSDLYRDSIFWVEVERIKPNPFQPRREFDQRKLEELAESIRMYGLLQPLTVTRKEEEHPDGGISVTYELIAGERRLRASKIAGVMQVPVIIRSGEDDDRVKLELAIIENLQREDLNPVDRAQAFHKLYKDFGFTHAQIGKKMGKSREYVSNTLRLLTLPEAILAYLADGRISEGHTRPLLMLSNKPEEQMVLAREVVMKKLTVRETENIARRSAQDRVSARHKIDPGILSVEQALTERLGTRVTIEQREVGGRLVISFFSAEDLQALMDAMKVEDERAVITSAMFAAAQAEQAKQTAEPQPAAAPTEAGADGAVSGSAHMVEEEPAPSSAPIESSPEGPLMREEQQGAEEHPREQAVEKSSETVDETVAEEQPKEEEVSAFETFLRALTGHGDKKEDGTAAPAEAPAEGTERVEPTGVVEPSSERPMPESAPESTPEPAQTEEKKEEDADLYSIRNFSI